ncbi:hypothetical protein A1O1_05489 [Capronia coronata CBS 617.96]|uniref:Uncharacterized protein n=1 Tax=Capronia coronata CBS 617.96 TaxID=1182541 RepID=W9Z223_9EURO|nr:uncharacterized protein A1O1_05489 [Capronia coronata CBS 617.96]EXJ88559.1 hypothetical protein A1O1_05489 [Capronia coronata CBS 617.96]
MIDNVNSGMVWSWAEFFLTLLTFLASRIRRCLRDARAWKSISGLVGELSGTDNQWVPDSAIHQGDDPPPPWSGFSSHLRKSSRPQSVLAYAATLARQQATLVECVETLYRRLRVENESRVLALRPGGAEPNVNDIMLSLGLDPLDLAEFDSEDSINNSKSQESPSASSSSPTMTDTSPVQDHVELQDTPGFRQASIFASDSSRQQSAQSARTMDRGDAPWANGAQYCDTPLPDDDMFGMPSFAGDLTPRALNPWTCATTYDTASYQYTNDMFDNPLGWSN